MMPGNIVLFLDEMKIKLCPRMFPEWSIPGMRHHVEATVLKEKYLTLFGAVNIADGDLTKAIYNRSRSREFIFFLEEILKKYPNHTIHIVMDNYSIHNSKETQQYLAMQPNIKPVYQPTYSFYLNCIELLWLYVRKSVCYNNYFAKLKWLAEEIVNFLDSLTPQRILQAVGVKT